MPPKRKTTKMPPIRNITVALGDPDLSPKSSPSAAPVKKISPTPESSEPHEVQFEFEALTITVRDEHCLAQAVRDHGLPRQINFKGTETTSYFLPHEHIVLDDKLKELCEHLGINGRLTVDNLPRLLGSHSDIKAFRCAKRLMGIIEAASKTDSWVSMAWKHLFARASARMDRTWEWQACSGAGHELARGQWMETSKWLVEESVDAIEKDVGEEEWLRKPDVQAVFQAWKATYLEGPGLEQEGDVMSDIPRQLGIACEPFHDEISDPLGHGKVTRNVMEHLRNQDAVDARFWRALDLCAACDDGGPRADGGVDFTIMPDEQWKLKMLSEEMKSLAKYDVERPKFNARFHGVIIQVMQEEGFKDAADETKSMRQRLE